MRRTLHALFVLAVVFHGPKVRSQTPVDPAFAALLQNKLDSCWAVFDIPGMAATVLLPGDRYWNGATGVADITTSQPMDTAFVFQAASVTKLFTATTIFQLIEAGALDLDDSIGTYLPPIPNVPPHTRIRYLLNQRSGIADYVQSPGVMDNWFNYPDSIWPPEQTLGMFTGAPLFAPNSGWSYSNTNYVLLGMLIEELTGNTFAEELNTRFKVPLGLQSTYFPPEMPVQGALTPGWAEYMTPGVYDFDVTPLLRDCFASMAFAAGAAAASPNDLARFIRALMTGALLSPASLATMRTCTTVSFSDGANGYGYGTMRYTYAGRTYFGHSGNISGFTQMTIHGEQDSVTLTLSINRSVAPRGIIAGALLAAVHQGLSVGLGDKPNEAISFDLFPVPASDRVTIRASDLSTADRIELMDAAGQLVRSERPAQAQWHELSVQGLAPGSYHLRWISVRGVGHRPLIVR